MAGVEEERAQRIEQLVRRLETVSDTEARAIAQDLMEAVLELHGAGLDRMLEIVFDSGDQGKAVIRRFAGDRLVSSLLVLHGLHPDDLQTRAQHALSKMHGSAEVIGVFEGTVRVRLLESGCGLRSAVESALRDAAPDAELVIEEHVSANGFVPLHALGLGAPGSV